MLSRFRLLKRIAVDLPRQARLAYCLVRDPRVPLRTRIAFGAGLGAIVTPFINLPESIPVVGELDMVALSLLAIRLFIAACPDDVVADVEQQIRDGRSVFDDDVRSGERVALWITRRFSSDDAETGDVHIELSGGSNPAADTRFAGKSVTGVHG